jgi:two-component system cell cycle response regulator
MDEWKSRRNKLHADPAPPAKGQPVLVLVYAGALDSAEAGRRFFLDGEELIIGRSSDADIQVDRDSVSRRHARISRSTDGWVVCDLQSTNGSYINDMPIREHKLQSGEWLKIGNAVFRFLAGPNVEALVQDEQYSVAVRDGLTQAYSRRAFVDLLDRELIRAQRSGRPLSLIAVDIDHCGKINDAHGHLTGDHIIKELARRIQKRMDRTEALCRYEGTQFLLLVPECPLEKALERGEELRQAAAAETFNFEGDRIAVTVSVGAVARSGEGDPAQALRAVQEQVQRAKKQGRNRVAG